MTAPNHIIGGIVITGLFGSFLNLNILASPIYIASTIFGALIPDIDYTKSMIGKIFRPISKYLNRRFGHRTITHSLLAMLGSFLLFAFIESTFFGKTTTSKIYLLGFFSHLILDMMTVQGVPLFYPFLRNPCVLPGNPNARFKTGNLHSETMIFCFFLLSLVFLQPLFANGFWTQYNRYFGTPKHLASEFHKSPDALNVKYTIKKGTEIIKGEGICISAKEAEVVLLEENGFHKLNKEKYTILEVIPEHIGKQLLFEPFQFFQISLDSLNRLVQKFPIKFLEIYSNQDFNIFHNNINTISKNITLEYPPTLFFQNVIEDIPSKDFIFFQNPKIQTLQFQIKQLEKEATQTQLLFEEKQNELTRLKKQFQREQSITEKEEIYQKIKGIEKLKISDFDFSKIAESKARLRELKQTDYIKMKEHKAKIELENEHYLNEPTLFTGTITFIIIE